MRKQDIPKIEIRKTLGFGEADQGKFSCIEFQDSNRDNAVLLIPFRLEAEFLARFQGACLHAAKARGEAPDNQIQRVMQPESVAVGVTDDHKIGLRLKLSFGMTLDLVMSDKTIDEFQKALSELEEYRKAGGGKSSQ